jgi:hypothetical protein
MVDWGVQVLTNTHGAGLKKQRRSEVFQDKDEEMEERGTNEQTENGAWAQAQLLYEEHVMVWRHAAEGVLE